MLRLPLSFGAPDPLAAAALDVAAPPPLGCCPIHDASTGAAAAAAAPFRNVRLPIFRRCRSSTPTSRVGIPRDSISVQRLARNGFHQADAGGASRVSGTRLRSAAPGP